MELHPEEYKRNEELEPVDPEAAIEGIRMGPLLRGKFGDTRFTSDEAYREIKKILPTIIKDTYFDDGLRWLVQQGQLGFDEKTQTYWEREETISLESPNSPLNQG